MEGRGEERNRKGCHRCVRNSSRERHRMGTSPVAAETCPRACHGLCRPRLLCNVRNTPLQPYLHRTRTSWPPPSLSSAAPPVPTACSCLMMRIAVWSHPHETKTVFLFEFCFHRKIEIQEGLLPNFGDGENLGLGTVQASISTFQVVAQLRTRTSGRASPAYAPPPSE
jgi:hypothetical protein